MSSNVQFLRNNRVALFEYQAPLTAQELLSVFERFSRACAEASEPIHSISDVSAISNLPSNVLRLLRASKTSPLNQPTAGIFVIVTRSTFIKTMVSAARKLMPKITIQVVDTIDKAWTIVDQVLAAESPA
jgi:hypothetical protein